MVCGSALLPGQPRPPLGLVGSWMQSPLARVLIGLVIAQGLFHGMRQFATGILLTRLGDEGLERFNTSFSGLIFWQVLQWVGLLTGAALAGSSETLGYFYGTLIGVGNGLICSATLQLPGTAASIFAFYAQPLIQAALGLVGGWIGSTIFKPLPEITVPSGPSEGRKGPRYQLKPLLEGPVHWARVLLGAVVAVAGALSAGAIFDYVLEASRGRLATEAVWQDQIFTWEIKVLALILGGALAGANTSNGFKQGLLVGFGAAAAMVILTRYSSSMTDASILFGSTLVLCILGGWFGGQLLPPVVLRPWRNKYAGPMV
jgi:hypothetical protein